MVQNRIVTVIYTEEIVSDAVRTYVWRRGITSQKVLWVVVEPLMIALFTWLIWKGERGWVVGVIGVVVLFPPGVIIAMWVAHHRNSVGKFRSMSDHRADFVFLNQEFEVVSKLGAAKIPWSAITELWEKTNYWMMFTATNQYLTLPIQMVSSADRNFLRSKISSAPSRKS